MSSATDAPLVETTVPTDGQTPPQPATRPQPPALAPRRMTTPAGVDGEVVLVPLADAMPRPLQYPPAVRQVCACGKNGTPEAHGAIPTPDGKRMRRPLTCEQVLEIRARVEADLRRGPSRYEQLLEKVLGRWLR